MLIWQRPTQEMHKNENKVVISSAPDQHNRNFQQGLSDAKIILFFANAKKKRNNTLRSPCILYMHRSKEVIAEQTAPIRTNSCTTPVNQFRQEKCEVLSVIPLDKTHRQHTSIDYGGVWIQRLNFSPYIQTLIYSIKYRLLIKLITYINES